MVGGMPGGLSATNAPLQPHLPPQSTAQQRHAAWCASNSLRALSGALHERVRCMFVDLAQRESEAMDAIRALDHERRDRIAERASLSDQVSSKDRQLSIAETRERDASDENRRFRAEAEAARSLRFVINEIRSVLGAAVATSAGGGAEMATSVNMSLTDGGAGLMNMTMDGDLPQVLNRQLQQKAELVGSLAAMEARVAELQSTNTILTRDCEALRSQQTASESLLHNQRALSQNEQMQLRSEGEQFRSGE